jgi:hypothetical protein
MRRPPTPRAGIYEYYWHFVSERHRAFQRRIAGEPAPWTADPIIQTYKFCNVFRAADRVSQYMIRNVCYHEEGCSPEDKLFQIVAFRTFSKIETWDGLRAYLGHYPRLDDLANGGFTAALENVKLQHGTLYTGAFILCATDAYGRRLKHLNHVELFRHMFLRTNLADRLMTASSLRQVYELLHDYPLMGDFMSYQVAIDLNYSNLMNFSENEFTQPGPGALRGIKKCFEDLGGRSPAEVVQWMVEHQESELERLGLPFQGLWGRPMQAIDCQNVFCETDKYCRVAVPELASGRKRIKAKFTSSLKPIAMYFPPKWGINDKLPSAK